MAETSLLQVRDLCVDYEAPAGPVRAVQGVSFDVRPGEIVGLAGESGSGKSTIVHAILRTLGPPGIISGGAVSFQGQDVLAMDEAALRRFRWEQVALVFQSAMNALNPVMRVGEQIVDTIQAHESTSRRKALDRARELLELVGINPDRVRSYPHELSGGMRQRVVIAIALALSPPLLIMDEPTTALDVVVERSILQKILELKDRLGFSVLFITHDLPLMLELTDRIGILYSGRLVELAPAAELRRDARHPYTQGLMQAFPSLSGARRELEGIGGTPPSLIDPPPGCRFNPRCPRVIDLCTTREPQLTSPTPGHLVACHLAEHTPEPEPAEPAAP